MARRTLASTVTRRNDLSDTPKPVSETAPPGADAIHNRKDLTSVSRDHTDIVKGDWVLFHPVYSQEELNSVEVKYRPAKTISDRVASYFVNVLRYSFDRVSGYKHKPLPVDKKLSLQELRKGGYVMDEAQWLKRIIFLESIAGVPGMVAAMLRHLRSLRLMRRDGGWIHTLLEEAENERMHLMTFMSLKKNNILFRAMILGAQGVFFNAFFLAYLISPRTCHRFVGHLEESAVYTYTHAIADLEAGLLPEWSNKPAPGIAIEYWRLPEDAKMRDVLYAVRSDETTHRFVNHSLANLRPGDANPFALREPDMTVRGKVIEFDRDESVQYVRESQKLLHEMNVEDAARHKEEEAGKSK